MQLFRDVLDECEFMDLGFVGSWFTWSKHFVDGHSIWERLNCGLANNPWFTKFLGTIATHLHCISSDHCPLLINLSRLELQAQKRPFRFEEMWFSDESCVETVEASWSSPTHGTSDCSILKRVDTCGRDIAWWNRNIFGNVKKDLEKKRALLIQAERVAQESGQNS